LEAEKKLVTFEVTAEDRVLIHKVERSFGTNMLLQVLDFNLGDIITSHSADGKSIYLGKFGPFGAQGLGIKLEEDCRFSAGYFSRGKLNGVCKVTLPENDLFIGNMNEDFPDGEGLFFDAQRKHWLYGYFKNFECITLLKDEITNANPYKRRIFANQYEKSRTCDRCAIEIPLIDFAKDFQKRFEPYLESLEHQLQSTNPYTSASPSILGSSGVENQSSHIKIKELISSNERPHPTQTELHKEFRGKESLKLLPSSKKVKSNKKSLSAENSERVASND
jgi:hypothetical protein